jgi:hypothetical protein
MRYSLSDFQDDIEDILDDSSKLLPLHYRRLANNYSQRSLRWLQAHYGVEFDYEVALGFTSTLEPAAEVQLLNENVHLVLLSRGLLLRVAALSKMLAVSNSLAPESKPSLPEEHRSMVMFTHPKSDVFFHDPGGPEMDAFLTGMRLSPEHEAYAYDWAARAIAFAVLHEAAHIGLYHHGLLQGAGAAELRGFEAQADLFALNNFLLVHGYDEQRGPGIEWYSTHQGWAALREEDVQRVLESALAQPSDPHIQSMHVAARCAWLLLSALPSEHGEQHASPCVRWWMLQNFLVGPTPEWHAIAIGVARAFASKLLAMEGRHGEDLPRIPDVEPVATNLLRTDGVAAYRLQKSVVGTKVFPGCFPVDPPFKSDADLPLPWREGKQ